MTITDSAEAIIGKRNTREFIRANQQMVRLMRPTTVKTEAQGIKKGTPQQLPEQAFRIVPMSGLVWDRSRTTPDEGKIDDVTEQLIGMPDADVQKNDYFPVEDGSGWYRVEHVSPVQGYRKEARLTFMKTEPT